VPVRPGCLSGWNVLLVTLDTVRADRLGCYGGTEVSTPVLDKLAAQGVRCRHAIAPAPLTLPSHASLLTGLDPDRHGARCNGIFRVDEKIVTLAERLGPSGYRTGAVISAYVLDRQFGLSQGFEDYADDLTEGWQATNFGFRERRASQTNEHASRWLRRHATERFFLWVHYFDPHAPYDPPEPYRGRFADRPYDGEVAYVDEQLGRLLKVLDETGARARTLTVVVGDHGESLGEHGELTHGIMIYDATQRVPMILNAPGVLPAGQVIDRQVGLVDVVPTVLDLLGKEVPSGLDGVSLLRPEASSPRALYIESLGPKFQYGWAPLVGLRTDDIKFILAPRCELYDLSADPKELRNILTDRQELTQGFHERLRARIGGDRELAAVSGNLPLDAVSRERLRSLGYVFETTSRPTTQQDLPDPKDRMGDWMVLQQVETLAHRGRYTEAVALLEPHLRERPGNVRAWQTASELYTAMGQLDRALAAYRREAELAYRKVEAHVGIASILVEMGKLAEAEDMFARALAEDPQSHRALYGLAGLRVRQNRPAEALRLYEQAIEMGRGSNTAMALFNIGAIHHAAGRIDDARRAFERALSVDPTNARAARALAELMRQEGRRQQAIELLRRTIERRPDAEALAAVGELLVEDGQLPSAAEALRQAVELRPDRPATHFELAMVLTRLGQIDPAIRHLRQCVELNPAGVDAHLHLGVLLAGQNRFAEAEEHLRRALSLSPNRAEGYYNYGVLQAMQGKLLPAVEAFERTLALQPKHAAAHNALGQALWSLNRTAEAVRHFRDALRIDPNLTAARENLERCTSRPATSATSRGERE